MTERLLFEIHGNELTPIARNSDPKTSHEAAAELPRGKYKALALEQLQCSDEPLTAAEVGMRCMRAHGGISESYRKRLGELVSDGWARTCDARICSVSKKNATTYEEIK